jgi:hypothetical protein
MSYINKEQKKNYAIKRPCVVCNIEKLKKEFNKYQQRCISCETKKVCKCYKCKKILDISFFKKDLGRSTGLSGMCKNCFKNKYKNTPRAISNSRRSRAFFKDCLRRLKQKATNKLYKDLGFTINDFNNKFPVIPKGYEIDHCIPLSWFSSNTPISISCSLHNLQILLKEDNVKKSNKFYDMPSDIEYFKNCLSYIDKKYLHML